MAVQHQHGAGPVSRRVRLHPRADLFSSTCCPTSIGAYIEDLAQLVGRTGPTGGGGGRRGCELDGLLLGLVDLLDAVRRHVHRPDQPRPHHPSVRRRRHPRAEHGQPAVVRHLRRNGHLRSRRAATSTGRAPRRAQLFGAAPAVPVPHRHEPAGDDPRRDLLRLRGRRGLHRDGHALQKGVPRTVAAVVVFWGVATGAVAAIMLPIADSDNLGGALTACQP